MEVVDSGIAQAAFCKAGSVDAIGTPEGKSGTMGRDRVAQATILLPEKPGVAYPLWSRIPFAPPAAIGAD